MKVIVNDKDVFESNEAQGRGLLLLVVNTDGDGEFDINLTAEASPKIIMACANALAQLVKSEIEEAIGHGVF